MTGVLLSLTDNNGLAAFSLELNNGKVRSHHATVPLDSAVKGGTQEVVRPFKFREQKHKAFCS